jgi:hypothetical protein
MPRGFCPGLGLLRALSAGLSPRRRPVLAAAAWPAASFAQGPTEPLTLGPVGWLMLGAGLCLVGTLVVLAWQQRRRGDQAALKA